MNLHKIVVEEKQVANYKMMRNTISTHLNNQKRNKMTGMTPFGPSATCVARAQEKPHTTSCSTKT